jgi:hypothetical protein
MLKALFKIVIIAVIGYIGFSFYADGNKKTEVFTTDIQGTINDIGELATAEYGYTIAQTTEKPSKKVVGFNLPFTSSMVMYSYDGLIKAGINFNEIKVTVNEINKTIFVELPDAEILSSEVDQDSLIVFDQEYSPFVAFTFEDMNLGLVEVKKKAEESAIDNGLLERANENVQKIIGTTMANLFNPNEYEVKFY